MVDFLNIEAVMLQFGIHTHLAVALSGLQSKTVAKILTLLFTEIHFSTAKTLFNEGYI